jgi:F0F1-type ATP synthase assembly protein I
VPADVEENPASSPVNRALYGGFGDALATAFELAAVTVLFALGGLWLDGRFGTRPVCMLVLTMLAIIGLGTRSYYQYKATMEAEEARRPTWQRPSGRELDGRTRSAQQTSFGGDERGWTWKRR